MTVILKILAVLGAGLLSYFVIANWIDYLIFRLAMKAAGYSVEDLTYSPSWSRVGSTTVGVSIVLVILRPVVSTLIIFGGGAFVIVLLGLTSWAVFGAFAYFFLLTQHCCLVGRKYSLNVAGWAMVITMVCVVAVYTYGPWRAQRAIQSGRSISENEYRRLVAHVCDVGPVRVHWYSQTLEPRRLVAYGFGPDSLVVDTWLPITTDTVHWSDLHLERVRLVDVGCDGLLDHSTSFPVEGAPTELTQEAGDWLWQSVVQVACEFSDFEGGSPLSVTLPPDYDSAWPDLSSEEELGLEQVMEKVFEEPLNENDLARLERAMRSYSDRVDRGMALWQVDVMDLMVDTAIQYKLELGRCLLRSIEQGEPCVSPELERLQRIQERFGFVDSGIFQADRVKLAVSASGAPYQSADKRWHNPPTKSEIVARMNTLQHAEANFAKISALFTRLIDEYAQTPRAPERIPSQHTDN